MKKNKKIFLAISTTIIVMIIVTITAKFTIARLHHTSPAFNFMLPPDDLYATLAETKVNFSDESEIYNLDFTAKYPGWHSIDITIAEYLKSYDYGAKFSVHITLSDSEGKIILDQRTVPPYSVFWGLHDCGFNLLTFRVPNDAPQDSPLNANVRIEKADPDFDKQFGPLTLIIGKGSDE